jgi:hypothetical protein
MALTTGKVCHIKAASPGGPRYDPTQTPEERTSIANAIWLCSVCSDLVDKDQSPHSVEQLHEWKNSHEDWLRNGGIIPKTPELSLITLHGFTVPETVGTFKPDPEFDFREHTLTIKNVSATQLTTIVARVQFPEPIFEWGVRDAPVGVHVRWGPNRPQMIAGGSVTRQREPLPTHLFLLEIDRLPPGRHVQLALLTSLKSWRDHGGGFEGPLWEGFNDPPVTAFYVDGTFQYEYQNAILTSTLFSPISCDKETRHASLIEVRNDYGEWKRNEGSFFS